ncbi:MAG: hypothetical protein ACOC0V_00605 [Oceanicaulis sp.]
MTFVRILSALGGLVLLGLIVWASLTAGQSLTEAISWLVSGPWGVVTLFDLYLGFFLLGALIWLLEPNKTIALVFILPLPLLGNLWTAVWFAWRLGNVIANRRAGA